MTGPCMFWIYNSDWVLFPACLRGNYSGISGTVCFIATAESCRPGKVAERTGRPLGDNHLVEKLLTQLRLNRGKSEPKTNK